MFNWEALIRIAGFGTTGVCFIMVVYGATVISRLPEPVSQRKADLIKFYLWINLCTGVISGATATALAYFNEDKADRLQTELSTARVDLEELIKSDSSILAENHLLRQELVVRMAMAKRFESQAGVAAEEMLPPKPSRVGVTAKAKIPAPNRNY